MILVVLGTQDKPFTRLLNALETQVNAGLIQDELIVQSGLTHFESQKMKCFDLLPMEEFERLMEQADCIITHGGVGTILNAVKKGKKVLACPRLAKYQEHGNDHQLQLCNEFEKKGYVLVCEEFDELYQKIEEVKQFTPLPYASSTHEVVKVISDYIKTH